MDRGGEPDRLETITWFQSVEEREPTLGDFTVMQVRLFLADAMGIVRSGKKAIRS